VHAGRQTYHLLAVSSRPGVVNRWGAHRRCVNNALVSLKFINRLHGLLQNLALPRLWGGGVL
jgi:hypothetical protein